MPCPTPLVFASQPLVRFGPVGPGASYNIQTVSYFNSLPDQYLGFGLTCDQAHDAIFPSLPLLTPGVVPDGTVINSLTLADVGMVVGSAITLAIDGVSYGSYGFTDSGFEDATTFPWPAVAGVNFFESVAFGISNVGGQNSTINLHVNGITDPFDADEWWCCNATGCVPGGCGGVMPFGGGQFLIPPPAIPTPGQENISTPLLYTPLYLSNHTYQFTANYGRVQNE